jgi:hypothetical protein
MNIGLESCFGFVRPRQCRWAAGHRLTRAADDGVEAAAKHLDGRLHHALRAAALLTFFSQKTGVAARLRGMTQLAERADSAAGCGMRLDAIECGDDVVPQRPRFVALGIDQGSVEAEAQAWNRL